MNFVTTVLPVYIKNSLLCFTLVNSKVLDEGPDIATCNSNGYMYEIKNKKVIRSLNLFDKGISICCSYILENEKLQVYYVILTENRKLLIIKRASVSLQVVRTFDDVKKFEVYDFECLGFPQIKISFVKDDLVFAFPIEEPAVFKAEKNRLIFDEDNKSNPLVESLEEKLQILNRHVDELNEEYTFLKKQFSYIEGSREFGMISVGSIKFSLPLKNDAQPIIKICDKWLKVFGSSLILGIKIHNCSNEAAKDVELLLKHEQIRDYVFTIFHGDLNRDLFAIQKDHPVVKPSEEAWVIGAFKVPAFLSHSTLSVPYVLTSGDLRRCLVRDSLEVTVLDIASRSIDVLEEEFTGEDLMAIETVKSKTHLEIRTEDLESDKLGSLLVSELGFRKIKHVKDELFYCTSGYLNEVFIALRQITENPSIWKMALFTSQDSQIYFLVHALYDLLPESTAISS